MITKNNSNKAANTEDQPGVEQMDRNFPDSRANKIATLEVGESYSTSIRLDISNYDKDGISDQKTKLRNTINKAASNAEKRSGRSFVIEAGEFFTRSYYLIITVVVTRLE